MYLWETSHNQSLGQADWALILGWHQKGLNAGVKRPECFNGHASPLGFSELACVFRWARHFLGPGEWACEPYFSNPITTYTEKVPKRFHMDKSHPLCSPMVVRSLEVTKDPFRPKEENEEFLGPEVPFLSAIGALMYLANYTLPNIAFSVNLLARYSSVPTKRHWNGIKQVLGYLHGTCDMRLFYSKTLEPQLFGYANASYLSDPHKA